MQHPAWLIPEAQPDSRRPNLTVYSSCHTHGILRYLNEFRPEERAKYNLTAIIIHVAADDKRAPEDPRFLDAFRNADILLHHPLASEKWRGLRAEEIGLKPTVFTAAMESPQASCFWPISDHAEMAVTNLLEKGWRAMEITRAFDEGRLECYFPERLATELARMHERDKPSDLRASAFVERNYRRQKMFFTYNHPTMPVLAFMVDQFLGLLGHEVRGEEAALVLPLMTDVGDNHWPETRYEWESLGLQYPRRYERNMGGSLHYHRAIERICEAWMANPDRRR